MRQAKSNTKRDHKTVETLGVGFDLIFFVLCTIFDYKYMNTP